MLDYETWQALVMAYAKVEAGREGFEVVCVAWSKSTRSAYVKLRAGSVFAEVRVSDHRPRRGLRASCFSVRRAASAKLHDLCEWLRCRRAGRSRLSQADSTLAQHDGPLPAVGAACSRPGG